MYCLPLRECKWAREVKRGTSEKPVCDVHWHFYKSPYPTALEWHKASVCIIQRRKKVIFEYCVIITGMCCFVFLQMNRILFAFEFHFLQLAPVSDICLFSSVQHALLLNVFLYSHPCYLTQRCFLFCRNTKENINNPSKWMLWLLMFYLLGGEMILFFFQSRLSGVTTKRGRTKGTQQVVWAGARRQHKHMHTYI